MALATTSPGAATFLTAFNVAYANGVVERHALSIDPDRTLRALGFFLLWLAWVPACAALIGRPRAARLLARNVAIVGTAVAVIGLAQKATFNGKLLWFWTPQFSSSNGSVLSSTGITSPGRCSCAHAQRGPVVRPLSRSAPAPGSDWRGRILWVGSRSASPVLLASAAALVMACSLVWTMSRSGIAGAGVAFTVLLVAAVSRSKGSPRNGSSPVT